MRRKELSVVAIIPKYFSNAIFSKDLLVLMMPSITRDSLGRS
jgi:hypothetical protein